MFLKFDSQVYVGIAGDGKESEEMLLRKLHVFNKIIGLLYGPVISR